ncbi:MAG: 3'-5' exonuclease, partial [Methylococcaceae bacterium]|nr:3'-5' exonuclease [Methylococcaceae bacterium]
MRLVFIDTETNDHPSKKAELRIVSITWMVTQLDGFIEKLQNFLVRPDGFKIAPGATWVHGISEEQARKYGHPINKILRKLVSDLKAGGDKTIIGHNVDFDLFPYHSNFGHFFAGLPLVGRLPIWRRRFCIGSGDSGGPWARR